MPYLVRLASVDIMKCASCSLKALLFANGTHSKVNDVSTTR